MNPSFNPLARAAVAVRGARQTLGPGIGSLILFAAILAAGCKSLNKPASASFASVILSRFYTTEQIRQTALKVFQQSGYQNVSSDGNALVFEREATRGEQISYAGIVGAQQGEKVVIQVRMTVEARDSGTWWVGCKAYAVCNPDQPVFSTTTALMNFQSKPYQKLLEQVKNAVQFPPAVP